MGRRLVRWKSFRNNLEILCHPICDRLYMHQLSSWQLRISAYTTDPANKCWFKFSKVSSPLRSTIYIDCKADMWESLSALWTQPTKVGWNSQKSAHYLNVLYTSTVEQTVENFCVHYEPRQQMHQKNIRKSSCYLNVQGGEDALDALSCRSLFAKEPRIVGLFCRK